MIDHKLIKRALRAQLATLEVATTGSTTLGATGATFTRLAGSFITDGFQPGMEVTGSMEKAANNAAAAIVSVAALSMKVNRTLVTEAAAAGKTLTVGLPSYRAWENEELDPTLGVPYVEEQYLPGPTFLRTATKDQGTVQAEPMYRVEVHVPEGAGSEAADDYTTGIEQLFLHGTSMALENGDTLRVRADTGPYRGQLLQRKAGWATVPVNIPLRLYTVNP